MYIMDRSQMIRWIALVHYMMGVFAGRFVCVLHTRSEKVGRIVSLLVTLLIIACSETVRVLGVYTRTHLVVEQCITDPCHPLQAWNRELPFLFRQHLLSGSGPNAPRQSRPMAIQLTWANSASQNTSMTITGVPPVIQSRLVN